MGNARRKVFYICTRKDQQGFKADTANRLQHTAVSVFIPGSLSVCLGKEEDSEVSKGC